MNKFILLIVIVIIISKNECLSQVRSNSQNLNISILLDLSDRIDPKKYPAKNVEYYQRDLHYVKSIQRAFINHVKQKKIIQLNDQMQVYFEPKPQNGEINKLSQLLRVSFNKNTSKEAILSVDRVFSDAPNRIYQSAIKDRKFIGADIWGFIKNNVEDYCIKPNHRNILFILTDGYMYHENSKFTIGSRSSYLTPSYLKSLQIKTPNFLDVIQKKGYGFIKAHNNLNDLEIVVLGINPEKGSPFEGDIIRAYWENWFKEMKVKKYTIKLTDIPSNLDPIIQQYINQNNR